MFVTYSCDSNEFPSVLSRPLKGLKLLFVIFPEIFFILLPKLTWKIKHEVGDLFPIIHLMNDVAEIIFVWLNVNRMSW